MVLAKHAYAAGLWSLFTFLFDEYDGRSDGQFLECIVQDAGAVEVDLALVGLDVPVILIGPDSRYHAVRGDSMFLTVPRWRRTKSWSCCRATSKAPLDGDTQILMHAINSLSF